MQTNVSLCSAAECVIDFETLAGHGIASHPVEHVADSEAGAMVVDNRDESFNHACECGHINANIHNLCFHSDYQISSSICNILDQILCSDSSTNIITMCNVIVF